ncbi:hypothetical protein [Fibrisoma montanum]|uniref:hypothetical protein n=1 Tax=Fibrisoma montanum TaxID=2305895 RepID=UPI001E49860F|nr:hypothetical protein [Fibrisoma montanum]
MVKEEGTDEKGDADAPDGSRTGFDAVVNEAGGVVWAKIFVTEITDNKTNIVLTLILDTNIKKGKRLMPEVC